MKFRFNGVDAELEDFGRGMLPPVVDGKIFMRAGDVLEVNGVQRIVAQENEWYQLDQTQDVKSQRLVHESRIVSENVYSYSYDFQWITDRMNAEGWELVNMVFAPVNGAGECTGKLILAFKRSVWR